MEALATTRQPRASSHPSRGMGIPRRSALAAQVLGKNDLLTKLETAWQAPRSLRVWSGACLRAKPTKHHQKRAATAHSAGLTKNERIVGFVHISLARSRPGGRSSLKAPASGVRRRSSRHSAVLSFVAPRGCALGFGPGSPNAAPASATRGVSTRARSRGGHPAGPRLP